LQKNQQDKIKKYLLASLVTILLAPSLTSAFETTVGNLHWIGCSNIAIGYFDCPSNFIESGTNQTCTASCNFNPPSNQCYGISCPAKTVTFVNEQKADTTIYIKFMPDYIYNFSFNTSEHFIARYDCYDEFGNGVGAGLVNLQPFWIIYNGSEVCTCQGYTTAGNQCVWGSGSLGVDYCPQVAIPMRANTTTVECAFQWEGGTEEYAYWIQILGLKTEFKQQTIPNENLKSIAQGTADVVNINVQIWRIGFIVFEILIIVTALFGIPVAIIMLLKWAIRKVTGR